MDNADGLVAIIGMAGRFPGADSIEQFWVNLTQGRETITRFPRREIGGGRSYVPAFGVLDGADMFDATFFGYSPREAMMLDPQHRLFLETTWAALEDAGYHPSSCPWPVGIYAGCTQTAYDRHVREHAQVDEWALKLANSVDLLTARAAYKLGLTGPAVTVQTACSTSLVSVHIAVQALLAGDCDAALAGGVSAEVPMTLAPYSSGGPISSDGRVRAFADGANGFVPGHAVGVVVLRRLDDARRDGDNIRAILRGSAVNHDGSDKVGFTAPSVGAQTDVIRAAHAVAGVEADTLTYVEAHGAATPLGDPIELAGLVGAFASAGAGHRCWLGSVKTNVGHTDAAAGITGLIKTVLALQHGQIPASLNFERLNQQIDFRTGPFAVNTELRDWVTDGAPRRAGVTSLSVGGTNAHVVVEQAPPPPAPGQARRWQLFPISAKTEPALAAQSANLAAALTTPEHPADVAWTLQQSRSSMPLRRYVVADSLAAAAAALAQNDPAPASPGRLGTAADTVVFVYPDATAWAPGGTGDLYHQEPVFRSAADACAAAFAAVQPGELLEVMYGSAPASAVSGQAAAFTTQYALTRLWDAWGITPAAAFGVGVGAYTAACAAGYLHPEQVFAALAGQSDVAARPSSSPDVLLPVVSDLTGTWLAADEAGRPGYWTAPRQTSHLAAGLRTLLDWQSVTLLELGPGQLVNRARAQLAARHLALACLPADNRPEPVRLLSALGELWRAGATPAWAQLHDGQPRRRVPLPGYPFQRVRHAPTSAQPAPGTALPATAADPASVAGPDPHVLPVLLELFAQLFATPDVTATDSFFELGADSLLGIELLEHVNQRFGTDLQLRSLYAAPVIADFAALVQAAIQTTAEQPPAPERA